MPTTARQRTPVTGRIVREIAQDAEHLRWERELVDDKLQAIIKSIRTQASARSRPSTGSPVNYGLGVKHRRVHSGIAQWIVVEDDTYPHVGIQRDYRAHFGTRRPHR
jgi:hypothetical protein